MKRCFIIMPISDYEGYPSGHFGRVYEFIIKPACEIAGFKPIRADEILTTNYIALDILKHIIDSEMAICDLSGKNPNVLYELGIRQAFNLPVTLIKDQRTDRIFDIQGFRDVEYDETLRIDSVQDLIEELSTVIKNTYENSHEVNSLISLLGIEPAKITGKTKIGIETELILNSISTLEKRLSNIETLNLSRPISKLLPTTLPDNIGDLFTVTELLKLNPGEVVYHERFGFGKVTAIRQSAKDVLSSVMDIFFDAYGQKSVVMQFVKLRKVL